MKLELKHLAPYLPYELKYFFKGSVQEIRTLESGDLGKIMLEWFNESKKPILRPLSDLTEEIEVNGNKFIPYEDDYLSDAMCSYENLEFLCEYIGDI